MSMYQPLIPTGRVQLDEDYKNVRDNFTQLNTTYGIDHYAYDNQTANNGFHNTVTTPIVVGAAHPATAVNVPKLYAMQDTAPLGVIQYSRGGNNAVPSPITTLQSPATPIVLLSNGTTPLLDFTGIARAMVKVYAGNFTAPMNNTGNTRLIEVMVWWNGLTFFNDGGSTALRVNNAGNVLQLQNLSNSPATIFNDIYWTLQILRVQV